MCCISPQIIPLKKAQVISFNFLNSVSSASRTTTRQTTALMLLIETLPVSEDYGLPVQAGGGGGGFMGQQQSNSVKLVFQFAAGPRGLVSNVKFDLCQS